MYNFSLDKSREKEFPNLNDAVYVDHAGTTLFSKSQMDAIHKDLTSNLYGNPHSHNYSSKLATDSVDQIRYKLLRFFGASPEEYSLIFTSGCTAALKLVADNFNFKPDDENEIHSADKTGDKNGMFCFLQDNHTSVQGIRGETTHNGITSVCLDEEELETALAKAKEQSTSNNDKVDKTSSSSSAVASTVSSSIVTASSSTSTSTFSSSPSKTASPSSLFAFPAQSNFSGKRYPLSWVEQVQTFGLELSESGVRRDTTSCSCQWYVLLDAASFVSSSPLQLQDVKPDFVTVSFYKIFGYPTGLGALFVHRRASHTLTKGYFGGGTVAASTAKDNFQMFRKSLHDRFEDGTLPFLSIICLRHGLDALQRLAGGMLAVSQHVFLVAQYFHQRLTQLQHSNGRALAQVYGGVSFSRPGDQGAIVAFNLQRANGSFVGYAEVDKFAQLHDVHLRTGCFCNIGACQKYLNISSQMIKDNLDAGHVCGDNVDLINGHPTGAVRISFGYMSTLGDARACLRFIADSFLETGGSPMPSFQYPQWYQEGMKTVEEGKASVVAMSDDDGGRGDGFASKHHVVKVKGDPLNPPSSSPTHEKGIAGDQPIDTPVVPGRTVTDIFLYPIKSSGAFRVCEWQMGSRGFLYDREWVLVSDSGVTLGQRREPKMCLIRPVIDLARRTLILNYPGESSFELPLDQEEEAMSMANLCNNKVCGDRVNTFDCGDAVADWLTNALLRPGIRLLRQQSQDTRLSRQRDKGAHEDLTEQRLSLANESQMLLLNRASVRALQNKMAVLGNGDEGEDSKMPTQPHDISEDNMVLRFRGNLVVDGGEPFEEETWTSLQVGDNNVVCQNVCSRCSMICMDQTKGQKSREPLRTLAMWRGKKVPFGVHSRMVPVSDGCKQLVRVGDCVTPME